MKQSKTNVSGRRKGFGRSKIISAVVAVVLVVALAVGLMPNKQVYAAEKTSEDGVYVQDGVVMCSCGTSIKAHQEEVAVLGESAEAGDISCSCGGQIVESLIFESPWNFTELSRRCTHGFSNGHDYEKSRTLIYQTKCDTCCFSSHRAATETTWECRGF